MNNGIKLGKCFVFFRIILYKNIYQSTAIKLKLGFKLALCNDLMLNYEPAIPGLRF